MCGRITLRRTERLREIFALACDPVLFPSFNIAPTQPVAAVRQSDSRRELVMLHWGLIPSWAKDPSMGARLINARAETAADKPAFRHAFRRRRCLIVADGFYEWQKQNRQKHPYFIHHTGDRPFGLGGLWEHWHDPHGNEIESCTILTTAPNELIAPLHDRMPLIVPQSDHQKWLDPATSMDDVSALLRPYPAAEMIAYRVTPHVNAPRNNDAQCIAAAPDEHPPQSESLFA